VRTLFGVSETALLFGVLALVLGVAGVLAWAVWRNPLLGKLAWRNMPRRPGFATLITLGLTIGTVILSSAFTTGDTMSQSVRTVVAGVLGSADEVVFIPSPVQRSGWDLAQSIASGSLLTGVVGYFPQGDVQQVRDLLQGEQRVAAIVPVVLEQAPVASEARGFSAALNLLGVPTGAGGFAELSAADTGARVRLEQLADNEVYLNTEAASALGAATGDTVHVYNLPDGSQGEAFWRVRAVTRLGDLGGGQATIFLPLGRLQALLGRADQVNQVLVINRGDPTERLAASWPITVQLRSAFLDEQTARRLYRAMSSAPAREVLGRAIVSRDTAPRLSDKLRRLQGTLDDSAPSNEFKALAQDPEVLSRLASRIPNVVSRGNTPFAAAVAGGSGFRVIDVQGVAQDPGGPLGQRLHRPVRGARRVFVVQRDAADRARVLARGAGTTGRAGHQPRARRAAARRGAVVGARRRTVQRDLVAVWAGHRAGVGARDHWVGPGPGRAVRVPPGAGGRADELVGELWPGRGADVRRRDVDGVAIQPLQHCHRHS